MPPRRPYLVPADHPVLFGFFADGCRSCRLMRPVARRLVADNAATGVELVEIDAAQDPDAIVAFGVSVHPTFLLFEGARHLATVTGPRTRRQVLREILPRLYTDRAEVRDQLRRQLGSPAELLPGRRGMLRRDVAGALEEVPLFAGLSKRELSRIARHADEVHVAAGAVLIREGEPGNQFFLITSGSATVRRGGRRLAHLTGGDFFGEMALLDEQPRSATVTADEAASLLVMERRDFDFLLEEIPGVGRKLLATMAERLRAADRTLAD